MAGLKINDLIKVYKADGNRYLVSLLDYIFDQCEDLKFWRKYFESTGGFAQNCWYPMWWIILNDLKPKRFLDIGVNNGQFTILPKLVAKQNEFDIECWGISPFDGKGDEVSKYEEKDYLKIFKQSCNDLNINFNQFYLLKGLSQNLIITDQISNIYFDLIYVDGAHDYNMVKYDIEFYVYEHLNSGGIVIFDDSNFYIPNGRPPWERQGYQDVVNAVNELMDDNNDFEFLFNCTHNRIFRKK